MQGGNAWNGGQTNNSNRGVVFHRGISCNKLQKKFPLKGTHTQMVAKVGSAQHQKVVKVLITEPSKFLHITMKNLEGSEMIYFRQRIFLHFKTHF